MRTDTINTIQTVNTIAADSLPGEAADSAAIAPADTISVDSIAASLHYGMVMTPPASLSARPKEEDTTGISSILVVGIILFAIVGLRFRNNQKYVTSLFRNVTETRLRHNVFDETVRETTFLVLLNLLWSFSAGILLYNFLRTEFSGLTVSLSAQPAACMGVCIGITTIYSGFMALAYTTVGTVFSDLQHAKVWLKGFTASQGLLSFLWLPLALISLFYVEWTGWILTVALVTFLIAKIVFIWKGFRIFFTQFSSWVLFLYYLCSLEIVPLILACAGALELCSLLPAK